MGTDVNAVFDTNIMKDFGVATEGVRVPYSP